MMSIEMPHHTPGIMKHLTTPPLGLSAVWSGTVAAV